MGELVDCSSAADSQACLDVGPKKTDVVHELSFFFPLVLGCNKIV